VEVRHITRRFLAGICGPPLPSGGDGVDLRCLQRKRRNFTGAELLFICFAVYSSWPARFHDQCLIHYITIMASLCLLLLVIVYGTGL
jgi:hypothetical protein